MMRVFYYPRFIDKETGVRENLPEVIQPVIVGVGMKTQVVSTIAQ